MTLRLTLVAGLALTSLSPPAWAQDPERWHRRPALPALRHPGLPRAQASLAPLAAADPELDRLGEQIATGLLRIYEEAARSAAAPPLDCREPVDVAGHQRALRALGRQADCMQWVATCERQRPPGTPGLEQVFAQGARCASADYQFARARDWHDRATRPENASSEVYPGMVYVFARFASLTEYQNEVPGILARNPAWSGSRLPIVQGSLEYLLYGSTTLAPETAIRDEVMQWMAGADALLKQMALVDWGFDLLWNRGRPRDSARFHAEKAGELTSPQEWESTARWALFQAAGFMVGEDGVVGDFMPARRVYEATLPYVHPESFLPISDNPFTYSQLYGGVCLRLTSGAVREQYQTIQRDWLAGRVRAPEAREAALRLHSAQGERADLLTLLGGLAEDLGRDGEARDWYWRAHQACPYYNRAHDGLANVRLRRLARAWSDQGGILARADRETRSAPFTPDVRHFVSNWASLADDTRKKILYGLRLWAPYVDFLLDGDQSIYFKRAPERLSDIEGFAARRDDRCSLNRLCDDIGGYALEDRAAIDVAWAAESPFFGGDITAHEVAHLFHFHDALPSAQLSCIDGLYGQASARALFADPYASINEYEYFAVGVEVFLRPSDAPPRFGPNVGWLRRNDPDLLGFLEQIAGGREPSTLACTTGFRRSSSSVR